jgi:hypothetical protein
MVAVEIATRVDFRKLRLEFSFRSSVTLALDTRIPNSLAPLPSSPGRATLVEYARRLPMTFDLQVLENAG